jgi:AcrR family transcriptional regulator
MPPRQREIRGAYMAARECDNVVIGPQPRGNTAIATATKSAKPAPKKPAAKPRATYHHGNLREAMVEATARLIETKGLDAVTVREAARVAGVSSGAPFRHFPNKQSLMTAEAEEAMSRFRAEIDVTLAKLGDAPPLAKFRALGAAYINWAIRNPAHFEVVSARNQIDYDASETLHRDNLAIQALMEKFLREAQKRGEVKPGKLTSVLLEARALSYGLARMYIDNHLPQWGVTQNGARTAMEKVFDHYIQSLAATGKQR